MDKEPKVFNDDVHGHIKIPALCVKIIDTPQFQRLRNIKQLGTTYFLYPGASHNRFEHSLGVCYLAGELVKTLQRNQPELKITDREILCIQIAGLCHDLGHGPYSHAWQEFVRRANPTAAKWKHENMSVKMFDHLLKENKLKHEFQDEEITFIKNLILGDSNGSEKPLFYFQIVANKENGIDVDKWDYFARDSLHLNIKSSFDHRRVMEFCRVIEVIEVIEEDAKKRLCYRDKEARNIFEMFYIRASLHDKAYQNKVTKVIDEMMIEAFCLADEHLLSNGKKLSERHESVQDYEKLTDSIFGQILESNDENLKKSKDLLQRILERKLYSIVGREKKSKDEVKFKECLKRYNIQMSEDDFSIFETKFDVGGGNPFKTIQFYKKDSPKQTFTMTIDDAAPLPINLEMMERKYTYLVCKHGKDSGKHKEAVAAFKNLNKEYTTSSS